MEGYEETQIIVDDLDLTDISSILTTWAQTHEIIEQLTNVKLTTEKAVKEYLRKRKWTKYKDEHTKINVQLTTIKEEKINKHLLKDTLTPNQYAQILTTRTKEQLTIITPKTRKRLKKLC